MQKVILEFDGDGRFQTLRRELGVSSFGINLVRLEPGQRGRIHRHVEQEEVYVVLEGTLTVLVENEPHELAAGQAARLAPSERRQLVNAGRERVVLLALGGSGEHVGRDGEAFESWDERTGRSPQDVPLPADLPS
jgi:uncharacterized cupin superfamily protein